MRRTAALCAGPAALLAWSWLRLERPHVRGELALWLILLGVAPALAPRLRWRLALLAGTSVVAVHTALHVWIVHPLRLVSRFSGGVLAFYNYRLPFAAASHPRMEGVILVALFASCAAVALAASTRRPVLAASSLLVAAGWPATLLSGPDDLWRGAALLAAMLLLVAGLGERLDPRRLGAAALVGAVVVVGAFGASSSSAVATGQVLHWQAWDFFSKRVKPVNVEYAWNSDYRGLTFPKKATTVLRIRAPEQATYWRATTLDQFDGRNWFEDAIPVTPLSTVGRDYLTVDRELPAAARGGPFVQQDVTVGAFRDTHLIGASVPVAYAPGSRHVSYAEGGVAGLPDSTLGAGDRYTVWSYEPHPTPRQLARLKAVYPEIVVATDLQVAPNEDLLPFGAPGRERRVADVFAQSEAADPYRGVYAVAQRVVGDPSSPYAAAVALEAWFRSGGNFRYDQHPRQLAGLPPLAAFVLKTHRGYCQHFAGAMALMLRLLGIPARVAAGFTSGVYDAGRHEWLVTDHDAHTWVEVWFPRYGWLPFDPTPGRGSLSGSYTVSSPKFDVAGARLALAQNVKRRGSIDLRKLHAPRVHFGVVDVARNLHRTGSPVGTGIGALLRLLALLGAAGLAAVVGAKLVRRRSRYLTRDPRRIATACARELADFLADQGAKVPSSATLRELARLVEEELGVSPRVFVDAATRARYGPPAAAREAASAARRELRTLRRDLRAALSRSERALGLVSLRSLGLTG